MSEKDELNHGAGPPEWAVILGISSGTGAAVAKALAEDPGLNIYGCHRGNHPGGAADVEGAVRAAGRECALHVQDAGVAEGAEAGARRLLETAGPRSVKMLVHSIANANLGAFVTGPPDRWLEPGKFDRTHTSMAASFVYWAQALVRHDLLAPNARLLGLTNTLGDSLVAGTGLVAAAKGALDMYMRQLAIELGPRGHRVNLLKFSTVITPALAVVFGPEALRLTEELHARLNPAGRICTVEEVGAFCSLLAGPQAAWFNGATIDFTGGTTLRQSDLLLEDLRKKPR